MKLSLSSEKNFHLQAEIEITGSKSESNRLLVLQALYPSIQLKNLSNSDDTVVMKEALGKKSGIVDIHHAGTAMRFATAYFAAQNGSEIVLTGSERMKQRPIGVLVNALKDLGAQITYEINEGYPPLRIKGRELKGGTLKMPGNISSQYISALLLIAPSLENGLHIQLSTEPTSVPYLKMTLQLLSKLGIRTSFVGRNIIVEPGDIKENILVNVESDWSSASYFYSIVAMAPLGSEIKLSTYAQESLQGDSALAEIYTDFGVSTAYTNHAIVLRKEKGPIKNELNYSLEDCPDLAQTIAVSCLGLGIACKLNGLHTLKIKETDRLLALEKEISKLGGNIRVTEDSLTLEAGTGLRKGVRIATYNDHRMAMAFAPLALVTHLIIEDAQVVSKSYPAFWEDLKQLNFNIAEV